MYQWCVRNFTAHLLQNCSSSWITQIWNGLTLPNFTDSWDFFVFCHGRRALCHNKHEPCLGDNVTIGVHYLEYLLRLASTLSQELCSFLSMQNGSEFCFLLLFPDPVDCSLTLLSSTHWGRMTHICVSKPTTIGSDNGLSPGRRHYLNQYWNIVNLTTGNKPKWNLKQNSYIFTEENAFENVVWKMASMLFRPQCVNT